jgi:RNA polymerase sigma-70 factor, ECF subfamily
MTTAVFDPPGLIAESIAENCLTAGSRTRSVAEPSLLARVHQKLCTDEELAEQLQRGNADALALLFKRHGALVFATVQRILGNEAEAEDTVQQVFLDVFRAIGQFDSRKAKFKTWLLLFAYHRTFNARRSLCSMRYFDTDPLDDVLPELLKRAEPFGSNAESRILVQEALASLSARQRRTIELIYFGGLTAKEASTRTGETVRAVRHNLYRGLEKLRKFLCEPGNHCNGTAKGARR